MLAIKSICRITNFKETMSSVNVSLNPEMLKNLILHSWNQSMEKEKAIRLLEIALILVIFGVIIGGVISLLMSLS